MVRVDLSQTVVTVDRMPSAGAFAVIRTGGFIGWVIRVLTRSRFNHAAIGTGAGTLLEATPVRGIIESPVNEYAVAAVAWFGQGSSHTLSPMSQQQRATIVAFGRAHLGVRYGFLDISALAIDALAEDHGGAVLRWAQRRVRARLMRSDRMICSQFVAAAYSAAGITLVPGKMACQVTPGDLAAVMAGKVAPLWW